MLFKKICVGLLVLSLFSCGNEKTEDVKNTVDSTETLEVGEVNVYSHRFYDVDKQLFEEFERQTGIKVNVKNDKDDQLIQLLQSEGENSLADVLITVDAGRLAYAKQLGLTQAINSESLHQTIPSHLRDNDNHWFGLTKRARVIIYSNERVKPEQLSTYEDLANPKWKGKINVRSSSNIYNQSLYASIIANVGEEKALNWAKGVVANFTQEPSGNDRDQIGNVAIGKGDLAIANTYYLGKLINSENEMEQNAAKSVSVFFPNQGGRGAHVNISGAAVTKYAKNKENAIKLIEFLAGAEAQKVYAESNYEYPVNPNIEASELLKSWGAFKEDTLPLSKLTDYNTKAIELFEKAGWK